ncbi:toxin Cry1Ac domain D-VI-related protein [Ornithinibacillus sp. FSL M8-0202]|uniref:toxin Cry1Ac domain D-VI-related protein n=1 Tax=Ornithinibacillus sp. FSL M8-0202 TaxID=2921616 RepID=UPI0030CE7C5B
MNRKFIASVVALLLLAGGTSAYAYTKHVQNQEIKRIEQIKMEALKDAQKAVDDLYTNGKNKLAEDLSEEKIENAIKIVEKLVEEDTKSDLLKEIAQVEEMFLLQKDINKMFENDVLVDGVTLQQIKT